MAAVRISFAWLGLRKTLAPEQRTTAARAFHADRELLSASKLILDTKNPAYRVVAAVRSEASTYCRTVTLPFPEAGIRLLPQNSLGMFAITMGTYRERLQEAARELAASLFHPPITEPAAVKRTLAGVERVWRAIESGVLYPVPSTMNCASGGYRAACRAWMG